MIILSIFLILFGLLMLLKPDIVWQISEQWKSSDATEPSDFYVLSTRIGGVLFTLAGIAGVVAFWFLD